MLKEVKSINKQKPNHHLIKQLEELLESARSGELTCLAFVDLYIDGRVGSGCEGVYNGGMLGELGILKTGLEIKAIDHDCDHEK